MNYTIKEKSELISLLELDHIKQSKLLNPQVIDKRFLLLLDILKKTSFIKIIIKKI
jgi:hypothetical protein